MTVLGLGPTLANLNRIAGQIVAASDDGLEKAAERIRDAWKENIVSEGLVDTGAYLDSVHVEQVAGQVAVLTELDYPGILEHGDSRIPPHPVAERAFDEHADEAVDLVGGAVGKVIG